MTNQVHNKQPEVVFKCCLHMQLAGFQNRANILFSLDIPCIAVLTYHNITLPEPCSTSPADLQGTKHEPGLSFTV